MSAKANGESETRQNGEKEPQSRTGGRAVLHIVAMNGTGAHRTVTVAAMTLVAAMTRMFAMLKPDGPKKAAAVRVIAM